MLAVSTADCGSSRSGSNPDGHPTFGWLAQRLLHLSWKQETWNTAREFESRTIRQLYTALVHWLCTALTRRLRKVQLLHAVNKLWWGSQFGEAAVCKTVIGGFESHHQDFLMRWNGDTRDWKSCIFTTGLFYVSVVYRNWCLWLRIRWRRVRLLPLTKYFWNLGRTVMQQIANLYSLRVERVRLTQVPLLVVFSNIFC